METQTRFDLNAAIANWQQELAAQPDLTPEVRRELETHLRDTIAELQQRGLNNEESFWLAHRRTGRPQQLSEEFAKGDPSNAWRDRVFWIVTGLLFVNFWGSLVNQFTSPVSVPSLRERVRDFLPGWVAFYLPHWLQEIRTYNITQFLSVFLHVIPVFLLAMVLSSRWLKFGPAVLNYIMVSRARFVGSALGTFVLSNSYATVRHGSAYMWFQLPRVLSLIALAAWMLPSKKSTVAKSA